MNFYLHCAEGVYTCLCVCVCATFLLSSTISRYTCRRRRPFQFIHLSHKAKKSFNGSPHCGTVEERGCLGTTPKNRFMGISGLKSLKRAPSQSVEAFFFVLESCVSFPLFRTHSHMHFHSYLHCLPLLFLSLCVCAKMLRKFVSFIK